MRTNIAKTVLMVLAVVIGILSVFIMALGLSGGKVYAQSQTQTKLYEYTISNNQGYINAQGGYEGGGFYTLAQGQTLENVVNIIDADRLTSTGYQDAHIIFENVVVGDSYFPLKNGNYTLSGALSGRGYSTFGLIYANGANVTFEDITLNNSGFSYLVKNDGNGTLTFQSGTYLSNSTLIHSKKDGNLIINGGTFTSTGAQVIDFSSKSETSELVLGESHTNFTLTASSDVATITAQGGNVRILGGKIANKSNGAALSLDNAKLFLANQPNFVSKKPEIITNCTISAKNITKFYQGKPLNIFYTNTIVSGTTVLVENVNDETLFKITNESHTLTLSGTNLVVSKTFSVSYQDPNKRIKLLPIDKTEYLAGDYAEIIFLQDRAFALGTLERYEFLGWSENQDAEAPTFTESNNTLLILGENVVLYPVWSLKTFTITYEGVEDAINNNVTTYNAEQSPQILNPQKQFYVFMGWKVNGVGKPKLDYQIPLNSAGDLTLEAVWEYQEFAINYINLPQNIINELNLQAFYTIESPSLNLTLEDVLFKGYAFYGIYLDENFTIPLNGTIYFSPEMQSQNTPEFLSFNQIGSDINFYVNLAPYFNGSGDGTEENPYKMDSFSQLKALVGGVKAESDTKIYVDIEADITYNQNLGDIYNGLDGFVINGKNHTLNVESFSTKNQTQTLFISISNTEINNWIVNFGEQVLNVTNTFSFAGFCETATNSRFENIVFEGELWFLVKPTQPITLKFGLFINAKHTSFNEITSNVFFGALVISAQADLNIYGAAIVGFSAENCIFSNCRIIGNLEVGLDESAYEKRVYLSGIASLGKNNKIINSLVSANVGLVENGVNLAFLSGIGVAFNVPNQISNVVFAGEIKVEGESSTVQKSNFVGASNDGVVLTNFFTKADFSKQNMETTLKKLNSAAKTLEGALGEPLDAWYVTKNQEPMFASGIVVTYMGGDMFGSKTMHFDSPVEAQNAYVSYNPTKFLFKGWVNKDGSPVNWEEMENGAYVVFAKYITINDWIRAQQTKAVSAAAIVLVLVIFVMVLLDMPKNVRFVLKGETVSEVKVGRTKKITLPEAFAGKMVFKDENGTKPFIKNKMPYYPLTLYVFDDEKQQRLEKFWAESQERKQFKKQKPETKKKKQQLKKTLGKKKQTLKTQVAKKSSKTKVIGGKDAKIVIVKKEVKAANKPRKTKKSKVLAEQLNMFETKINDKQ